MSINRTIYYILLGLVPYYICRKYFPETPIPTTPSNNTNLAIQGGSDTSRILLLRKLVGLFTKDRAVKIAILTLLSGAVLEDSRDAFARILLNASPALLNNFDSKPLVKEIASQVIDMKNSNLSTEQVKTLIDSSLSKNNKVLYYATLSKMKGILKQLFKLSKGDNRLFWLSVIILFASFNTPTLTFFLAMIRQMLLDGEFEFE